MPHYLIGACIMFAVSIMFLGFMWTKLSGDPHLISLSICLVVASAVVWPATILAVIIWLLWRLGVFARDYVNAAKAYAERNKRSK